MSTSKKAPEYRGRGKTAYEETPRRCYGLFFGDAGGDGDDSTAAGTYGPVADNCGIAIGHCLRPNRNAVGIGWQRV